MFKLLRHFAVLSLIPCLLQEPAQSIRFAAVDYSVQLRPLEERFGSQALAPLSNLFPHLRQLGLKPAVALIGLGLVYGAFTAGAAQTVRDPTPQFSAAVENAIRDTDVRRPTTVHPLSPKPGQRHRQFFLAGLALRQ